MIRDRDLFSLIFGLQVSHFQMCVSSEVFSVLVWSDICKNLIPALWLLISSLTCHMYYVIFMGC